MKYICRIAFFAALLPLAGCFGAGSPESSTYDLAVPAKRAELKLRAGVFRNFTPVELSLQYQLPGGRVLIDPYRMWSQSPENMLRGYLLNTFGGNEDSAQSFHVLDCTVFEFRTDMEKRTCRLGVEYVLRWRDQSGVLGSFSAEEKFQESTPEAISMAFSRTAGRFADHLAALAALKAAGDAEAAENTDETKASK